MDRPNWPGSSGLDQANCLTENTIIIFHQRQGGEPFQILGLSQQENGIVGRWFVDSGLDLMACTHPEGPDNTARSSISMGFYADVARRLGKQPSPIPPTVDG